MPVLCIGGEEFSHQQSPVISIISGTCGIMPRLTSETSLVTSLVVFQPYRISQHSAPRSNSSYCLFLRSVLHLRYRRSEAIEELTEGLKTIPMRL